MTKPKNKVITKKQTLFVKNQNLINDTTTNYESEFHKCMKNVMRLCRWFGLFPVEELDGYSWDKLKLVFTVIKKK